MKLKEFLSVRGIGFTSINVLTEPHGLEALRALGARSVPVLARGSAWIFAQSLSQVVQFLGLTEAAGPVLAPPALIERLVLFLETAIRIVPDMPDRLMEREVPNRPRSYLALGHHLFRIPEGMLEVAAGATLTNGMLTGGPPPGMQTGAALSAYGDKVLARLLAWWTSRTDQACGEMVRTYYGPQSLHEVLERTTWHCGQHVRQWFMLLDMAEVTPSAVLDQGAFAGLPMPGAVWDG